jgi:hypothetical protein
MLMQIIGVFRNCLCAAGLSDWWHIGQVNPAINLAADTQEARDSSYSWLWMGSVASAFMVVICYVGWWYQRLVRRRFEYAVEELYIPSRIDRSALGRLSCEFSSPLHLNTCPLLTQ